MSFTATSEELPISGLCIIEQNCPTGYVMIDKCQDNQKAEADLWKDHLFARKMKRFLCVTRIFPLDGGRLNNVLADITIIDERDAVPSGYSKIGTTQDSGEPALKKKCLCVKMIPRSQANDAITDVIFLSKGRRAPPGYTLTGELSGLMLCYKIGPVPQDSVAPAPALPPRPTNNLSNPSAALPYPLASMMSAGVQGTGDSTLYMNHHQSLSVQQQQQQQGPQRQMSRVHHPLNGIPFEISPKFVSNIDELTSDLVRWEAKDHLLQHFDYSYQTEEQALNTFRNYYVNETI